MSTTGRGRPARRLDRSPRLGVIVLAGGRSTRFGRDKLAAEIDGRPLLVHAVTAVAGVGPDLEFVVVTAPGRAPVLPAGVRVVVDAEAFGGPLAGLATGLEALAGGIEIALVVGGDMPTLVPDVLALLIDRLAADPTADVAFLADGDRWRPLPAAVRPAAARAATASLLAAGERRLRALADVLGTTVVPAADWRALDPDGRTLHDIDLPGDLPGAAPGG